MCLIFSLIFHKCDIECVSDNCCDWFKDHEFLESERAEYSAGM